MAHRHPFEGLKHTQIHYVTTFKRPAKEGCTEHSLPAAACCQCMKAVWTALYQLASCTVGSRALDAQRSAMSCLQSGYVFLLSLPGRPTKNKQTAVKGQSQSQQQAVCLLLEVLVPTSKLHLSTAHDTFAFTGEVQPQAIHGVSTHHKHITSLHSKVKFSLTLYMCCCRFCWWQQADCHWQECSQA